MKKFISILTLLSLLNTTAANAQEKKPSSLAMVEKLVPEVPRTEKDLGAAISPLKKFQASPFTGVLLSPLAAATLIADLNARNEEMSIEIDKAKKEAEAKYVYEKSIVQNQCTADKDILTARIESNSIHIKSLEKVVNDEIEAKSDPVVWGLIGLAIGVVSAAATASVITAATQ